jgi:hypothetical protein
MPNPRPLCAAPHCNIRNRHRDTCPDPDQCWGCLPRWAADGLRLCDVDTRRLAEDAARCADLYAGLEQQIIRDGGSGEREKTSGSSTGAPVPDDDVMENRGKIRALLMAIVRLITEQRGVTWPNIRYLARLPEGVEGPRAIGRRRTEELPALAAFITRHAEWLAAHRYGPTIARDLRSTAGDGRLWGMAYPAGSDRLYVGDCPAILVDDDGNDLTGDDGQPVICGRRLYQYPDQPLITCTGCGIEETIEQWRRWLVGDAAGQADAYMIASHLSQTWMRPVDPAAIKKWAQRGHLAAVTEDDGEGGQRLLRDGKNRTQYRIAEALEYAESLWGPPAVVRRAS